MTAAAWKSQLKQAFGFLCIHDWVITKHQIGRQIAVFTIYCHKCETFEDLVYKVSPTCGTYNPVGSLPLRRLNA